MTDRLKGFVVILDEDIREDDAQPILDAIQMIRGVLEVTPMVNKMEDLMARERVRAELEGKLFAVLRPQYARKPKA